MLSDSLMFLVRQMHYLSSTSHPIGESGGTSAGAGQASHDGHRILDAPMGYCFK
jgi:hypothetical protein